MNLFQMYQARIKILKTDEYIYGDMDAFKDLKPGRLCKLMNILRYESVESLNTFKRKQDGKSLRILIWHWFKGKAIYPNYLHDFKWLSALFNNLGAVENKSIVKNEIHSPDIG